MSAGSRSSSRRSAGGPPVEEPISTVFSSQRRPASTVGRGRKGGGALAGEAASRAVAALRTFRPTASAIASGAPRSRKLAFSMKSTAPSSSAWSVIGVVIDW